MKKTLTSILVASLAACSPPADDTAGDAPTSPAVQTPAEKTAATLSPSGELLGGGTVAYDGAIPMAIMVGSNGPQADGCGAIAKVAALDGSDVDYLSVRDAPNGSVKERDRLNAGQQVAVCAISGEWSGVIYAEPGAASECGVASPVATEEPYRGPCRQGWVVTQYLDVIAG